MLQGQYLQEHQVPTQFQDQQPILLGPVLVRFLWLGECPLLLTITLFQGISHQHGVAPNHPTVGKLLRESFYQVETLVTTCYWWRGMERRIQVEYMRWTNFLTLEHTTCMQIRSRVKAFLAHGRLVWVCVATIVMHSGPTRSRFIRTLFSVAEETSHQRWYY